MYKTPALISGTFTEEGLGYPSMGAICVDQDENYYTMLLIGDTEADQYIGKTVPVTLTPYRGTESADWLVNVMDDEDDD